MTPEPDPIAIGPEVVLGAVVALIGEAESRQDASALFCFALPTGA